MGSNARPINIHGGISAKVLGIGSSCCAVRLLLLLIRRSNMHSIQKLVFGFIVFISSPMVLAEISWSNEIKWIAASSKSSSTSHFIEWKNPLQNVGDCVFGNGKVRTRLSFDDKELFSLLLTAFATNKKVSFYYSTTVTSGVVPGHGTGCQLRSVWLESK